ncbi:MAG TPA: PEP-CTERM sorting domain-containing protein [Tepidisphaeraceae bacterium]|nr:PEP-CTERM sorting domain-containing protein [Tepidisphaeraceae bacterium]
MREKLLKCVGGLVIGAGAASLLVGAGSASAAPLSFDGITTQFSENFDSMGPTGTSAPAGYRVGTNTPEGPTVAVLDVTPGNAYVEGDHLGKLYNVGIVGALSDRALSVVNAGANRRVIELAITNDSAFSISTVSVGYDGEQWGRDGSTGDRLDFRYAITPTGTTTLADNSASFVNVDTLDFVAPDAGAINTLYDANAAANRVTFAGTPIALASTWDPGETLIFHWTDINSTSLNSGLSIDNVVVNVTVPEPTGLIGLGLAAVWPLLRRRR